MRQGRPWGSPRGRRGAQGGPRGPEGVDGFCLVGCHSFLLVLLCLFVVGIPFPLVSSFVVLFLSHHICFCGVTLFMFTLPHFVVRLALYFAHHMF